MPRKEFEGFTRLDASDVNTYLMDQSIMSFAGTAARGSAIETPVEGMATYLQDSNVLSLYDGTNWKSSLATTGGILQVISTVRTETVTSTATSFTTITGMSASITPKSTSNKILVIVSMNGAFIGGDSGRRNLISIFRGETNISNPTSPASRSATFGGMTNIGTTNISTYNATFLDSPATTSETTYTVRTRMESGDTLFINRTSSDTDSALFPRGVSTITLMEVAS
jgi:hypothetical protein